MSGFRGKLILSLLEQPTMIPTDNTAAIHQEIQNFPNIDDASIEHYQLVDNIILEEKQCETADVSEALVSQALDLQTLPIISSESVKDSEIIIEDLQPVNINHHSFMFEGSSYTTNIHNPLENVFVIEHDENIQINEPPVTQIPDKQPNLENSNLVIEKSSHDVEHIDNNFEVSNIDTDEDYIPESESESDRNSDTLEDGDIQKLVDAADMYNIRNEIITQQNQPINNQGQIAHNEGALEVDHGNMLEGRKRGIKRQEKNWKKNVTKRLRMEGKAYMGYSRKGSKVTSNIHREARKLGLPCNSKECKRSANRHCSEITEPRLKIFSAFWDTMNWDQRKIFVINHVRKSETKRTYTKNEDSRRKYTLQYFLTVNNEEVQICKRMFLQTLCLGEYSVQDWIKAGECGMTSSRECNNKNKRPSLREDINVNKAYLTEFLDNLVKLPSHYGRSGSSKLYLETTIQSLNQLFTLYKEKCNEDGKSALSRTVFSNIFYSKNLSLYPIKKDKCDLCTKHEVGQLSDEEWNIHRQKKQRARDEKNSDKEIAKTENRGRVLTIDLQAVKVCPFVQASAIFFKLKLSCHNFTVYDTVSHQATCFWFTETEADMTASTFASCLLEYLETKCRNESGPIIIYSDGCTYQNRNNIMSNALLNYAVQNNVEIVQKFLEVGHTQMECDSVHSCIERKLKGKDIHLPSDFIRVTREARSKPTPYDVRYMQYTDFKDYTQKKFHRYASIRPGKVVKDPVVTDLRALRYLPNDFDEDWKEIPQRAKKISQLVIWPAMYSEKRKIKKQKWQHLQLLKSVIPVDCHSFYDNLEYNENE